MSHEKLTVRLRFSPWVNAHPLWRNYQGVLVKANVSGWVSCSSCIHKIKMKNKDIQSQVLGADVRNQSWGNNNVYDKIFSYKLLDVLRNNHYEAELIFRAALVIKL